jgi:hypothetical protein
MAISVSIKLQPIMPQHLHIEIQNIMGISYVVEPTPAHHPNSGSQVTDLMLRVAIL